MYEFPIIKNITDVLPAIEGSPEFIVAEKDGYKVVNYMVVTEDTFPTVTPAGGTAKIRKEKALLAALRRECRGIKFDSVTGDIIARPYHKFFNVNERPETAFAKIDLDQPHFILEKLDGSMVHPMYVHGIMRWATKMGITDTSMQAEEYIVNRPHITKFAEFILKLGMTPIFEWCSDKNRIVISYPEDRLYLTGIRDMTNGKYVPYFTMVSMSASYGLDYVSEVNHAIFEVEKLENTEGIVIRLDNGHMYKLKSEWYALRHKSKDAIMREKNVLDYIVNDRVDDVLPYLTEADAEKLKIFRDKVLHEIRSLSFSLETQFIEMSGKAKGSRKDFAAMNTGEYKGIFFKMLDGHHPYDHIINVISSKCGTQTGVDSVRHLFGNLRWEYAFNS